MRCPTTAIHIRRLQDLPSIRSIKNQVGLIKCGTLKPRTASWVSCGLCNKIGPFRVCHIQARGTFLQDWSLITPAALPAVVLATVLECKTDELPILQSGSTIVFPDKASRDSETSAMRAISTQIQYVSSSSSPEILSLMPTSEVLTEVTMCRRSNRRTIYNVTSQKLASHVKKNESPPLIRKARINADNPRMLER